MYIFNDLLVLPFVLFLIHFISLPFCFLPPSFFQIRTDFYHILFSSIDHHLIPHTTTTHTWTDVEYQCVVLCYEFESESMNFDFYLVQCNAISISLTNKTKQNNTHHTIFLIHIHFLFQFKIHLCPNLSLIPNPSFKSPTSTNPSLPFKLSPLHHHL